MSTRIKRIVIPIVLLLLAIIIATALFLSKPEPEKKVVIEKAFLVDAKPIFYETVEFLVHSQGSVQPKNKTMLSTQVSGRVLTIADNFIEGGFFKKGEVLLALEVDDYQTDLLLAEAELARVQANLDEEIAKGRVAEQEWASVNLGTPPELGLRKPQLAREKANLKAAKANLERAKRNLSRTRITAPYDGLIKSRTVNLGQFVPMGSQIGEIYSVDVAEIRLPLTDNDVAFLANINEVQPEVSINAEIAGKPYFWQGRLVRDEAVLDESKRVIYGVVEVKDPYNLKTKVHSSQLKFGRFVSASITGITASQIVKLPRFVMRLDGTVLTVSDDRKLQINAVDVIRTDEDFAYISGGLPMDHQVVMSAVSTPYDGMPVRLLDDNRSKDKARQSELQSPAIIDDEASL